MKKIIFTLIGLTTTFAYAQSWGLTGNSGTSNANFLGTTDNQTLFLKSNNKPTLQVLPEGAVRVYGDTDPYFELSSANNGRFQIAKAACAGCWGADEAGMTVMRNMSGSHSIILSMPNNANDGGSFIGIRDGARGTWIRFFNNGIARFDGKIIAKEVEVKSNVWADYVFSPSYTLQPLSEVEQFIKKNNRLPNIPSEKTVLSEGINVSEMTAKLLEKIEELTLYAIEQEKEIKKLQSQNQSIQVLEDRIKLLENSIKLLNPSKNKK